eukprot:gene4617-839_t
MVRSFTTRLLNSKAACQAGDPDVHKPSGNRAPGLPLVCGFRIRPNPLAAASWPRVYLDIAIDGKPGGSPPAALPPSSVLLLGCRHSIPPDAHPATLSRHSAHYWRAYSSRCNHTSSTPMAVPRQSPLLTAPWLAQAPLRLPGEMGGQLTYKGTIFHRHAPSTCPPISHALCAAALSG